MNRIFLKGTTESRLGVGYLEGNPPASWSLHYKRCFPKPPRKRTELRQVGEQSELNLQNPVSAAVNRITAAKTESRWRRHPPSARRGSPLMRLSGNCIGSYAPLVFLRPKNTAPPSKPKPARSMGRDEGSGTAAFTPEKASDNVASSALSTSTP